MTDTDDCYALITGGSQGIGKAISEELASRKYNILLVAHSLSPLEAAAKTISAKYGVKTDYISLDLSVDNASEVLYKWCLEKKYMVTILVNNAGYGLCGAFKDSDFNSDRSMLTLNMITLVRLCHTFLPMLASQNQSYILNVASTTAYQAIPSMSLYAASKSFVLSFSRGLYHELKKTTIQVSCLCPGATTTKFIARAGIPAKASQTAQKVSMSPEAVARIAIEKMFKGKVEIIPGFINKLGAFLPKILPHSMLESLAGKLYQ
jgi:hypothetical protein